MLRERSLSVLQGFISWWLWQTYFAIKQYLSNQCGLAQNHKRNATSATFFSDVLKYYLCKLLHLVAEYRLSKNYVVHVWLFWGIYWKHQRFSLVINQMGDKSYVGVTWRVLQSLFDWISSFSLIVLRVNKLKLFFFLCCVIFCQYKKTVVKCRKLLFSSRKSGSSLNSPRLMTIFFCYLTL